MRRVKQKVNKYKNKMKRPENVIVSKEYIEPNCFESNQEAVLFYAYLDQEKYIDELEKQLSICVVVASDFLQTNQEKEE